VGILYIAFIVGNIMKKRSENKFEPKIVMSSIAVMFSAIASVSDIVDVTSQISSFQSVIQGIQASPDRFFRDNHVLLPGHAGFSNDFSDNEFDYQNALFALTAKVKLSKRLVREEDRYIGGLDGLLVHLSNYKRIVKIQEETFGKLGYILIQQPIKINELKDLTTILDKHSVFYAPPDGTETFNINNIHMGRGLNAQT